MKQYRLLGIDLLTDLELPCRLSTGLDPVVVTVSDYAEVPSTPPPGEIVAELTVDGRIEYIVSRQVGWHVLRVPTICDLWIADDLRSVRFTPSPGTDRELLGIILAGAGVSTMLALRGTPVLHGSTVATGGRSLGFLGASGQGKSTMTALFCMAGWKFMGDDVLRVDVDDDVAVCHPGGLEIRLRPKALRDPCWPTRTTTDGRGAVSPPAHEAVAVLDGLVIPFPARGATHVEASRLSPGEAVEAIRYYQRIGGWSDPSLNRAFFAHSIALGSRVPVWVADIPWDENLTTEVVSQLADLVLTVPAR